MNSKRLFLISLFVRDDFKRGVLDLYIRFSLNSIDSSPPVYELESIELEGFISTFSFDYLLVEDVLRTFGVGELESRLLTAALKSKSSI